MDERYGLVRKDPQVIGQPGVDVLRELLDVGGKNFPFLTEQLSELDLTDDARREAILQAATDEFADTTSRGQWKDLEGFKGFLTKIGVESLTFGGEIVETIRELNDRVGDAVFTTESRIKEIIDGKMFINDKCMTEEEADRLQEESILRKAGYNEEEIPTMVPKFHMLRGILCVLRYPYPNEDFCKFVLPLFGGQEQADLRVIGKGLLQLPPAKT